MLNLEKIASLQNKATNPDFCNKFAEIKRQNKRKLIQLIRANCNITVPDDFLFDIQVKRIHEYKRQLMNVLYVVKRYNMLKAASVDQRKNFVKRMILIGGKAAPSYEIAKLVIKLISSLSDKINNDPDTKDYLKLVFYPNYNVSSA